MLNRRLWLPFYNNAIQSTDITQQQLQEQNLFLPFNPSIYVGAITNVAYPNLQRNQNNAKCILTMPACLGKIRLNASFEINVKLDK